MLKQYYRKTKIT